MRSRNSERAYYYFDEKPVVPNDDIEPSACETNDGNDKASTRLSKCLQNICGGGKSHKRSDVTVMRALMFLKFCFDEIAIHSIRLEIDEEGR